MKVEEESAYICISSWDREELILLLWDSFLPLLPSSLVEFIYFRFGVGEGVIFVFYLILLLFVCFLSFLRLGLTVQPWLAWGVLYVCFCLGVWSRFFSTCWRIKRQRDFPVQQAGAGPLRHSRQNQPWRTASLEMRRHTHSEANRASHLKAVLSL